MATEPKAGTQNARILAFLRSGRSIGPLTSWQELGIYRLASRICELRQAGWNIIDERRKVFNRFGEPCSVSFYKLEMGQ